MDEIDFNVTSASDTGGGFNATTGVATITPQSGLPGITNAVFIDGYSQPGSSGNTNPFGQADNAVLKVELNGSAAGNVNGLGIGAPNTTVRGLVINSFTVTGVVVAGSNDWVYGNFIGVNPTGTVNDGNGTGVWIFSANNATIGSKSDGHDALERNLISGNGGNDNAGIFVTDNSNTVTIQGDYLGTDATGNSTFAFTHNSDANIKAFNVSNLNILGNVISGGAYESVMLLPNVNHATIQGNRIGTNAAGTVALGNTYGIYMAFNIHDIQIGGTSPGQGNLISGNAANGVTVASNDCYNITLQGNFIGTDVTGTYAIPNGGHGFAATGTNLLIGGTVVDGAGKNVSGNLVSGNAQDGISVAETAGPVLIQGNTIGTDATGSYAIGNSLGIQIRAASGVTVGGATQVARNLVSGNVGGGILDGGTGDLIEGNFVGTDPSGTRAVPNGEGLYGEGGVAVGGMSSRVIDNLVSGNDGFGISPGGAFCVVQGNKIGTDLTGTVALPNQGSGVFFSNSDHGLIGGPGAGQGNLISGNTGHGIEIRYPDGNTANRIQGNRIGTNAAGTAALGNGGDGVFVYFQPATDNVIGGSGPGEGNMISGNGGPGIDLTNSPVTVQGNDIGTDVTGSLHLGNAGDGVFVISNLTADQIGGTAAGSGNTIAFNSQNGVFVLSGIRHQHPRQLHPRQQRTWNPSG